jgi:large subunit ribosomal protein L20
MNKGKIFKLAKGFRGRAKNCIRIARERVEKALQYSYRDRRNKKRDMRSLWIERINAGTRLHGVCFHCHISFFKEMSFLHSHVKMKISKKSSAMSHVSLCTSRIRYQFISSWVSKFATLGTCV